MTPKRIQRKRTKGWRMPENTKSVTRPGKWGNPFRVGVYFYISPGNLVAPASKENSAYWFSRFMKKEEPYPLYWKGWYEGERAKIQYPSLSELTGFNLACFCPLCEKHKDGRPYDEPCEDCPPCHADVLLELANRSDDE